MRKKLFYNTYDGESQVLKQATCTECNSKDVGVVSIIAEHNAGEIFSVEVCRNCLLEYADLLKGMV